MFHIFCMSFVLVVNRWLNWRKLGSMWYGGRGTPRRSFWGKISLIYSPMALILMLLEGWDWLLCLYNLYFGFWFIDAFLLSDFSCNSVFSIICLVAEKKQYSSSSFFATFAIWGDYNLLIKSNAQGLFINWICRLMD